MKIYSCSTAQKAISRLSLQTLPFQTLALQTWAILPIAVLLFCSFSAQAAELSPAAPLLQSGSSTVVSLTSEEDHQRSLALLGIDALRPGVDGSRPGEPGGVNYTEEFANPYPDLPDPLLGNNGVYVENAAAWWQQRRPEILTQFDREIYGKTPEKLPSVEWEVRAITQLTINGIPVVKKNLAGRVDNRDFPEIDVVIQAVLVLPIEQQAEKPVIMQLISEPFLSLYQERAQEPGSWQSLLLQQGWGYAYLDTYSVQADNGAGLTRGIIGLVNQGQPRRMDDWGVLKAWGWGASKLLDYFEADPAIDATRTGIEGHSRWGKAALVTMAYDPRFSVAYISSSGAGGAKLHRRNWGELVENVAAVSEYHWMAGNYLKYAGPLGWNDLPVDAHHLIALCAPRGVFIGAGNEGDFWVDARGMFMATANASAVYTLLGGAALESDVMPAIETGLMQGDIAFRQHNEGHTDRPNWPFFIDFARRYF